MRIFDNPNFNFIKWRWQAMGLSAVIIVGGLITVIARGGLPLGVDFTGGTVIVAQFNQPVNEDAVRDALGSRAADAIVQRIGAVGANQIMIRLPLTEGDASLDASEKAVSESLRAAGLGEFTLPQRELVSPTIGSDLRGKAIWATVTALGGILAYIAFRFRLSFAVGAVVATFHDILVTLAFLTWFGYDLSLNVVAAILTIAGYSVNDTVVVFDRVRETQRLARKEGLEAVVNRAVNQTLSRTVITAGTTLLAVLALFLFGGDVLRGFAFTMIVGVIAGTYSTVFIASSVAIILSGRSAPLPATQPEGRRRARA